MVDNQLAGRITVMRLQRRLPRDDNDAGDDGRLGEVDHPDRLVDVEVVEQSTAVK